MMTDVTDVTESPEVAAERDRLRLLLDVSRAVASHLDLRSLFSAIAEILAKTVPHDHASLTTLEPSGKEVRMHALRAPGSKGLIREGDVCPALETPAGFAILGRTPLLIDTQCQYDIDSPVAQRLRAEGLQSGVCVPLIVHDRCLGSLNVGSLREKMFDQAAVELLEQVAQQIAPAVENALTYQELQSLKDKLAAEKLYLEDEIRSHHEMGEIVGESAGLRSVLDAVRTVAPTDATVLVRGETGTGKELVARALHDLSGRRDKTLVKVNCAAIPTGLLESELFGHEKGAFTGAVARKPGRFELADQGTLFLDEVGEIPLELQPKLLRVLQEQQFERLGGTKTLAVNVRIVAATNRDLAKEVAEGRFRSDLFYRLNVFPLELPPLRERPEDVPLLVKHFVAKHARKLGRRIDAIATSELEALARHRWPGNIRELENFVERSVIRCPGGELRFAMSELSSLPREAAEGRGGGSEAEEKLGTLADMERDLILRTLRATKWVVGGPGGAAARLGLNRTTLQSRMRKLGIERPL